MFERFVSFQRRRVIALSAFIKAKDDLEKLVEDMYSPDDKISRRKQRREIEVNKLTEANADDTSLQVDIREQATDVIATIQKINEFVI